MNLGLPDATRLVDQAERAYRLALNSDQVVFDGAAKSSFLLLWRGDHKRDGIGIANALKGKTLQPTSGAATPERPHPHVWNDVGMGDAFQFVRYTLPLLQRGEKVRFAVAACRFSVSRASRLAAKWLIASIHLEEGPQIP